MRSRPRAFGAIVGAWLLSACVHNDGGRSAQTTTSSATFDVGPNGAVRGAGDPFAPSAPQLSDPSHPANRLGTAACERKRECEEQAGGGAQTSEQACLVTMRGRAHEELERMSCENGLDDARLDDCIAAVRAADCAAVETLTKVGACSKDRLCAK